MVYAFDTLAFSKKLREKGVPQLDDLINDDPFDFGLRHRKVYPFWP